MTDAPTAASALSPRAARPGPDPASPFFRAGGRHRFTARRAHVVSVEQVAPALLRVRVTGPEFGDFQSGGPADHVRVFFPDPETGELVAPTAAGPGEDGIVRPDAPMHARDFTPLRVTAAGGEVAVELDFYLHPSPGPASRWASDAGVGDKLVFVGPRGSRAAPQGAARLVLVVDETALPSATRWAAEVPATTTVDVIATTADDGAWVDAYARTASRPWSGRSWSGSARTCSPARRRRASPCCPTASRSSRWAARWPSSGTGTSSGTRGSAARGGWSRSCRASSSSSGGWATGTG